MEFDFKFLDVNSAPEPPQVWPAHAWGDILYSATSRLGEHIQLKTRKVPEGMLTVLRCAKCGGLEQYLADLTTSMELFRQGDVRGAAQVMEAMLPTAQTDEFVERHRQCDVTPMEHHVPEEVRAFTDFALAGVTESLAAGETEAGIANILTEDGVAIGIDIGSIPDGSTGRRDEAIMRMQWAVRELMRRENLSPLAISFVSEAWASTDVALGKPSVNPNRFEIVIVTIMTQNYAHIGIGRIVRDSGEMGEGPGHIEDFQWSDTGGQCYLLEGLLAL